MKKIFGKLAAAAAALTMIGSLIAVPASAESQYIYTNDFSSAAKIAELTRVGAGKLDGKPNLAYSSEKNGIYFEGWGNHTGFMLPAYVKTANFVMEADFTYEKTSGYRDRGIGCGFVFAYQDSNNFSDIVYYPLNGNVTMHNTIDGNMQGRNAEQGNGASFTVPESETAHVKIIVNNGLMEFFVNDELCYTYYSDAQNASGDNKQSRDFTGEGRLGLYVNADKTMVGIKNLTVRTVDAADTAYYSNSWNDNKYDRGGDFKNMSELSSAWKTGWLNDGNWGELSYFGDNWENVGIYKDQQITGDYTIDMNFSFKNPRNASRFIGLAIGGTADEDGGFSYIMAGVKPNGDMVMEQKKVTKGSDGAADSEATVGSNKTYGSCKDTIPEGKKNVSDPAQDGETPPGTYLVSYMPDGFAHAEANKDNSDVTSRRHNLHIEVADGVVSMTFEGKTITLEPDAVGTDGIFGIRSAGTDANIYSLRAAPYTLETVTAPAEGTVSSIEKVASSTEEEGSAAAAYMAAAELDNSPVSCTWYVSANDSETVETAESTIGNGASIDGTAVFGLIVEIPAENADLIDSLRVNAKLSGAVSE